MLRLMTVTQPIAAIALLTLVSLWAAPARAQCVVPGNAGERSLIYTFEPVVTPDSAVLHITVSFRGTAAGQESVRIPTQWAGEELHAVSDLKAVSPDTSIDEGSSPGTKIVRYPANRQVVLSYDLKKDWTGPLVNPKQFHPVVMPEYFEINGENGFVSPALDDEESVSVSFDFSKLPQGWNLATSFGATDNTEDRCQSYSGKWEDVKKALFAAGDLRIRHFNIGERPAVLAVRGEWTFSDDTAIKDIQSVVSAVRNFWHEDDFPYFLVTLKPYDRDHGSSDGSQFTNAFWMYVSRLDSLSALLPQLAHEAFHAWNPGRMGYLSNKAYDETKWFKEGFTEYYAHLLTYRSGFEPLQAYVDSINRDLRRFRGSQDEYIRGRIIALWLDSEIRTGSAGKKSLDDVMFDMVHEADRPLTLERIFATADRYLSEASRSPLRQAVGGGDLPVPGSAPGTPGCVSLSVDDQWTFELGLDLRTSQTTKVITGVQADGPAFRAGLRDGQALSGVSVYNNDPDRMARFTVQGAGGPSQTISYYPRGNAIKVPQYHLQAADCGAVWQ
jgi:predicted metalloprotease with PDZ domain